MLGLLVDLTVCAVAVVFESTCADSAASSIKSLKGWSLTNGFS